MVMDPIRLDPGRQAQARKYARTRRAIALGEMGLGVLYLSLWIGTSWAAVLRDRWIDAAGQLALPSGPAQALVLFGVAVGLGGPWWLATLPVDFFASYTLPHRYGLSNQTVRGWVVDRMKGGVLGGGLAGSLLLGLYALLHAYPKTWWWLASLGYGLVTVWLTAISPILLIPLFYRMRRLGDEHAEISHRLQRLAAAAGLRVQGVYILDMSRRTKTANAMLVGLGRTRRILVGDTLLDSFEPDEIETILAHELGHHVHADIVSGILVGTLAILAVFGILHGLLSRLVDAGALRSPDDPAGVPVLALAWATLSLLQAPLLNLYSRWREARADSYALTLTGKPEAFARAMVRLGDQNLAEAQPPRWAMLLFATHPSLRERIGRAESAQVETEEV